MEIIRIKEVMSAHPVMARPTQSVKEVAELMREHDCGVMPVGMPKQVLGIVTDRDITIRVTAEGKGARGPIEEVMTRHFISCEENDTIEHAAELMRKHDVSRLLVSNGDEITGIVSIADLLRNKDIRRESDKVLHELLGRKLRQAKQTIPQSQIDILEEVL